MKAYILLSDRSKWCQGAEALNARGARVSANNPAAVRWCMLGAVVYCYGPGTTYEYHVARIRKAINRAGSLGAWNDARGRTYEQVVDLLKRLDI